MASIVAGAKGMFKGVGFGIGGIGVGKNAHGALMGTLGVWVGCNMTGFISGIVTKVDETLKGFALGVVDIARSAVGVQVGAVTIVKELLPEGILVQIGVLNIDISADRWYKKYVPLLAIRRSRKGV